MEYLPLFHNLKGRTVLIVGGGEIALRKARLLSEAGARLRVVAPSIEAQLVELVQAGAGECLDRGYARQDLQGCVLAIAATDDEPLNATVSQHANALGVPVNVVDSPQLCSVIFPAIVDRSPLVVAVSSGGDAPVLARLIRARIETWIPAAYGQLAGLAKQFRAQVKARFANVQQRRVFWEEVFQGPIAEQALAGRTAEAERLLAEKLAGVAPKALGEVYLVGAGPGDPDLLTFRALRLMQQADVVLYDRLVAPAIVALARKDAERFEGVLAAQQQDRHPAMARRFLEFRHDQPATQEKIGQIWLAVMRANNGELEPPYRLDGAAWAAINELKFPRRRADDLHALTKSIEYWAVSVELAFLAWKDGDMKRLGAHLSEEEAAFLAPLFP